MELGKVRFGKMPKPARCGDRSAALNTTSDNLTVNFSPMSNPIDSNNLVDISDFVNYTIVTDADSPIVLAPAKFPTACRSGISRESSDRANNSVVHRFA
jgi:hypothetical protein